MKLKQITLHDAIQCAGEDNVYIMIRLTDDTPVEQLRQADGYFVEEEAEPVSMARHGMGTDRLLPPRGWGYGHRAWP